jgi:hypothetical protein
VNGFVLRIQEHASCPLINGWHAVPDYYKLISFGRRRFGRAATGRPKRASTLRRS